VATVQEYRNWEAAGVKVKAEWSTAGDDRVCEECEALEGKEFSLQEIEDMIPYHPNCRCIALPLDITESAEETAQAAEVEEDIGTPIDQTETLLKDPQAALQYRRFKRQYEEQLDELDEAYGSNTLTLHSVQLTPENPRIAPEMQKFVDSDPALKKMRRTTEMWQQSTRREYAFKFKAKAAKLEKDVPDLIYDEPRDRYIRWIKEADDFMTDEDYLRIRAFNQAYMDRLLTVSDEVIFYRGIGGDGGRRMSRYIASHPSDETYVMKGNTIVGMTTDKNIGDGFRIRDDGISIRTTIPKENVVIHRDMVAGLNGKYLEEQEWIVRGLNSRKLSVKDNLRLRRGNGSTKDYGEDL
jgi:hypothetical protein